MPTTTQTKINTRARLPPTIPAIIPGAKVPIYTNDDTNKFAIYI